MMRSGNAININTTALMMWNVAGNTHTHETNSTRLHIHRQSDRSSGEKRWVLRADLNTMEDTYLLQGVIWNGMLYDVECLWPGWTTECEVVQNGVVKKSVWCEMVA